MEIQEGAEQTPSAPLQAGHARFWQRPSHISHRDSLGLSAPQIRPGWEWAQGSGPGTGGDGAAPNSPLLPPAPAGPSGVPVWPGNLEEGSRERLAGVGNKAPRSARRRSVPHPAPGRPPSPRLRLLGELRLPRRQPPHRAPPSRRESFPSRKETRHRGPGAGNSRQFPSKLSAQTGKTLWRLETCPHGREGRGAPSESVGG